MAKKNPRLAKINRSYTVEEIAELFQVHKNTVSNWIKEGLAVCDTRRPKLIHGRELRSFLESKHQNRKRPCGPGQIYCVSCKEPKLPLNQRAILRIYTEKIGDLCGDCPDCGHRIYRKVSLAKIDDWKGDLKLADTRN